MTKQVCFVGQLHYFDCAIPEEIKGYKIHKINVNFEPSEPQRYNPCIELQQETQIDTWIFFRGEFVPREILNRLQGKKIWISTEPIKRTDVHNLYFGKNSLYTLNHINLFDEFYHYDKTEIALLAKANYTVTGNFALPVNLAQYNQTPPSLNKIYDLIFLGRTNQRRAELTGALKKDYKFLSVDNGLWGDEAVRAYNMSSIGLSLQVEDYKQFPHRIQNMMACGLPVIADSTTQDEVYENTVHFLHQLKPQQLYLEVTKLLGNPDKLKQMSLAGLKLVKAKFDASKEWLKLLEQNNIKESETQ